MTSYELKQPYRTQNMKYLKYNLLTVTVYKSQVLEIWSAWIVF